MNIQTQLRATTARHHRAFRRPHRRRRHLGRGRGVSSDAAVPGHDVRGAGDAGQLWRDVADPSLSRHPLRQRPAHLRLSLQAVDLGADRDRGGNPGVHGRGDRGERSRSAHPLSAHDPVGVVVERGDASGPSMRFVPTPGSGCASRRISSGRARATTATRRATRRSGRAWRTTKAASCIRSFGPTTSTTRERASS